MTCSYICLNNLPDIPPVALLGSPNGLPLINQILSKLNFAKSSLWKNTISFISVSICRMSFLHAYTFFSVFFLLKIHKFTLSDSLTLVNHEETCEWDHWLLDWHMAKNLNQYGDLYYQTQNAAQLELHLIEQLNVFVSMKCLFHQNVTMEFIFLNCNKIMSVR